MVLSFASQNLCMHAFEFHVNITKTKRNDAKFLDFNTILNTVYSCRFEMHSVSTSLGNTLKQRIHELSCIHLLCHSSLQLCCNLEFTVQLKWCNASSSLHHIMKTNTKKVQNVK